MSNKRAVKHVWMVEDGPRSGASSTTSLWTKIGIALENADGSLTLTLSAIPVSGRMIIRDPVPASPSWPTRTRGAA